MVIFRTVHTIHGLQRMAAAEASGTPINLTHMAVGDGLGNDVTPDEEQTQLARELFRATVNRVFQDPAQPTKFTAELIIPATHGGFTMREVGIFDANGSLFAVGNLPATYKPNISEGAYSDTVVRLEFMATNGGIITLQIDPNVAVATQTWISNNVTAATLLPGGTTDQVLCKKSNAPGDTEWRDPTVANVTVDMVEEVQTLAADQTIVDLVQTTTRGLALYIDLDPVNGIGGERLRSDQWTKDPIALTRLTLAQSYPAGAKLLCVQNEPAGSTPNPLIQSLNLADLADKATARDNLGVYSKPETDARGKAPGDIFFTARTTAPGRSLKANGALVSRTAYADLFAAIGTRFGAGDGFTNFALPDMRAAFPRGWDDGRGLDAGRALGSWQGSQNLSHMHYGHALAVPGHQHDSGWGEFNDGPYGSIRIGAQGSASSDWDNKSFATSIAGGHGHDVTTDSNGGNEARPANIALLACIQY